MRISLDWLNSYLDRPVTADEVEAWITDHAFPVEGRTPVGSDVALEVEVTSNRPDCLSHVGVAREVTACSDRKLKLPSFDLPAGKGGAERAEAIASVENKSLDLCPLYTARVIRGVKVGPSPAWLVKRLEAVGLRSVNNVVDVTNFVLFELAQPLHAFDLAKLSGRRIVVRTATPGEAFTAIDGTKHKLTNRMLVIADATRPVAIAGVMGGVDSEVSPATTDVLLESAIFAPLSVRQTSRALKLSSDSSYRFERGVDPEGVERASKRAAALIVEVAGGTIAEGVIRIGKPLAEPRTVELRPTRCQQMLGIKPPVTTQRMTDLLARLELQPKHEAGRDTIVCRVPTFRLDLDREVDLIEEVARLHGLDHVQVEPKIEIVARPVQPIVAARQTLREVLVAHGFYEAIGFSFVTPAHGKLFLPAGDEAVMIDDERRKNEPMLRPSLVPSLLATRKTNQDVGNSAVKLFEIASVWSRRGGKIVERTTLGLFADATDAEQAMRSLRGTVEDVASQLTGEAVTVEPTNALQFTAAGEVRIVGKAIGVMGVVSPATLHAFDLQTGGVAAELDVEPLLGAYPPKRVVQSLTRFPGIERDLSVVVDEPVRWSQIAEQVDAVGPALLESTRFLIAYRGKPIPPGRKSVSFRMTFRDPERTLRHEQVDPQVAMVVEKLKTTLGAELRA